MTVLPQNGCDCTGVVDVTSDHQAGCSRVDLTDKSQSLLCLQQHLLSNATAVRQADGPPEIAGSPALSLFLRKGRHIAIRTAFLTVLHPAILKPEFQGSHIPCGDQLTRLDTQVGLDLLNPFPVLNGLNAASRTETEVVSSKGCAGQVRLTGITT